MTKKDFSNMTNPAATMLNEVTSPSSSAQRHSEKKPTTTSTGKAAKNKSESRSSRLELLLTPTNKAKLKALAQLQNTSVNAIINELVDSYLNQQDAETTHKIKLMMDIMKQDS